MARTLRQSKILEIISTNEIFTQDELVEKLRELNFDVTQATISRDIKELGLIKASSTESGKNKYAYVETNGSASNKYLYILKEAIISIKPVKNLLVLSVLKGLGQAVCNIVSGYNLENCLGSMSSDDTATFIFYNNEESLYASNKLETILNI